MSYVKNPQSQGDRAIKEALGIKKIVATDKHGVRGEVNLAHFKDMDEQQITRFLERYGYSRITVERM